MKKNIRVTLLSSLGAGFEYYDFVIYGLLAQYLAPLFFIDNNSSAALLKTFSIFTVGYLVRPFGGIIFGLIADKHGRKSTFTTVMFLMAISTFLIGILPTTYQIGSIAMILLIICRIGQGISFGAELPGAITVVSEYNNSKNIGLHCSIPISSAGIGASLASIVLMLLTSFLSYKEIIQWGWRIPFILGGVLAIISFIIRFKIKETPAFQKIKIQQGKIAFFSPLLNLAKYHYKAVLVGIAVNFFTSSLVIVNIYSPSFLQTFFNYTPQEIFQTMTVSLVWSSVILIILGRLSDKYGRLKMFKISVCLFIVFGYFIFNLLFHKTFLALLAFFMLYQVFVSTASACSLSFMAEIFPTPIRFTAIGTCYNISYLLAASIPLFLTYQLSIYSNPLIIFYTLWGIAWISLMILTLSKHENKKIKNAAHEMTDPIST